ncbi:hypothetical protein ABGW24_13310 [Lactococcus lactis]
MITPKMIADKTMTPAKRKIAYNDFFAFYIGGSVAKFKNQIQGL